MSHDALPGTGGGLARAGLLRVLPEAGGDACGSNHAVALARRPGRPVPARAETVVEREILRCVGKAVGDYDLIAEGDRIAVALSGGKDSYALLRILRILQKRAPVRFTLAAVHVLQGAEKFRLDVMADYLRAEGVEFHVIRTHIFDIVKEKKRPEDPYCPLCSRLRRGTLYSHAAALGFTKIALGHHQDDILETLLLNQFFTGQLKAMPVKLRSDDGRNVVIRPLALTSEAAIREYAREQAFPVICCGCPACGELDNQQRKWVRRLLGDLDAARPGLRASLFAAAQNVRAGHLLDRRLLGGHSGRTASGDANEE